MSRRYTGAPWETDPADLSWVGLPVYDGRDEIGEVTAEGPGRVRVCGVWLDVDHIRYDDTTDPHTLDLLPAGSERLELLETARNMLAAMSLDEMRAAVERLEVSDAD